MLALGIKLVPTLRAFAHPRDRWRASSICCARSEKVGGGKFTDYVHQEVEENVVSYIRHVYGPEKPSGTKEDNLRFEKNRKLGYLPKPASGW